METVDELVERLIGVLFGRDEVLEAYLFGSHARGTAREYSDIDVAVFVGGDFDQMSGFGYRATLTSELMRGLGTNRVDVVVLNSAPPLLYHRVLRDGVRLFSRDLPATTGREGRALSRYCDYSPQLAKIDAVFGVAHVPKGSSS